MDEIARIQSEVTFLPTSEGGRMTPPMSLSDGRYRPHIVVRDPNQRQGVMVGKEIQETYLGVIFLSGPDCVEFGKSIEAELGLLYYPHSRYESVVPGATFTIREGARIVGFGKVKALLLPEHAVEHALGSDSR